MNEAFALIAALAAGALVVTKTVDLFRSFDKADKAPSWVWIGGAFVVGVAYCVGWQINLTDAGISLVPALAEQHLSPLAGSIVTGLCFGAGADFWHKVLANISASTDVKRAA
jgi:hypothetical protein